MAMFLNNVPQASQTLGQTQNLILTNFQNIDAAFQVDHVPYTQPGQGKHNRVTFPLQATPPSFTGTDSGMYSAPDSFSGSNQIFIVPPGSVSPLPAVPMTANLKMQKGYSYLPSGIILQWGFSSFSGTTANIIFAVAFTTIGFSVTATEGPNTPNGKGIISITALSTTGFTAVSTTGGENFYWQAIGY